MVSAAVGPAGTAAAEAVGPSENPDALTTKP